MDRFASNVRVKDLEDSEVARLDAAAGFTSATEKKHDLEATHEFSTKLKPCKNQAFDSPLISHATCLTLSKNFRAKGDKVYAALLARVRLGKHTADDIEFLLGARCDQHACDHSTPS